MNSVTSGQRVEQEQVDDAESAPEFAEPLEDQPRVADARDGAEPHHHLLVDVEHRDQEHQRPQQCGAIVLAGLGVGAERAGIVVADHHDQAGPDDRESASSSVPRMSRRGAWSSSPDGAERTADIADMGPVEDRGPDRGGGVLIGGVHIQVIDDGHDSFLLTCVVWLFWLLESG
jgi:hypothetical protein